MRRVNTPELTPEQRIELESSLKNRVNHCLRMRRASA